MFKYLHALRKFAKFEVGSIVLQMFAKMSRIVLRQIAIEFQRF